MKKILALLLVVGFTLGGCQKAPVAEISNAGQSAVSVSNEKILDESDTGTRKLFQTKSVIEENMQDISLPMKALREADFDGARGKKMTVIGGSLMIADDVSAKVMLYQYNADTLQLICKKEFPSACTVGFSDSSILVISRGEINYFDENLEATKTVLIKKDSYLYKSDVAYRSTVVVDETHIAWFAHDRSVYVIDLITGKEIQIDPSAGIEKTSGLYDAIYPMETPCKILIAGSLYQDGEDPSIVDEDNTVFLIADIRQGVVEEVIYEKELMQKQAALLPHTAQIYAVSENLSVDILQEVTRSRVSENGILPYFKTTPTETQPYCLLDLTSGKRYTIPEKTSQELDLLSACSKDEHTYFILTAVNSAAINYLAMT